MTVVPKGATLLEIEPGIIPTGLFVGQRCVLELYRSMSSQGYKTSYEQVPTFWLQMWYEKRRFCTRFSATNPDRAAAQEAKARVAYESNVKALRDGIAAAK